MKEGFEPIPYNPVGSCLQANYSVLTPVGVVFFAYVTIQVGNAMDQEGKIQMPLSPLSTHSNRQQVWCHLSSQVLQSTARKQKDRAGLKT